MTNTQPVAIGVDLGGTKIAFALVDSSGNVLDSRRLDTPARDGADAVFKRIADGVNDLMEHSEHPIIGVGIGSPGHLNPHTGHIYKATNLAWDDVNLFDGVRPYLAADVPLWLAKDANAATMAEWLFGAGQNQRDFVLLTIGTGLGGGAICEGQLVLGADFSGMEIGHTPLDPTARMCVCGMRGCPEMYVSGVGLLAGAMEYLSDYPDSALAAGQPITTTAILDAYAADDALAVRLMEESTDWLCSVMIACMGILNPALFVIGGGLGHATFDIYAQRTHEKLKSRTRREIHQRVPILKSQVTHSAIGPACLVWQAHRE